MKEHAEPVFHSHDQQPLAKAMVVAGKTLARPYSLRILEITPYEPPASGWVTRIKLLRKLIREGGATCEILDIGPSRKIPGRDCIPVKHAVDYIWKILSFSFRRFTFHCHINGEYLRGLLLALAACLVSRCLGNRCVLTFHGGTEQPLLTSRRNRAVGPLFWLIFSLPHGVVCNSEAVKKRITRYRRTRNILAIPAFSRQYLEYKTVDLGPDLEGFVKGHSPLISTYLCFRPGFFADVVVEGMARLLGRWPRAGLVVVGTGDKLAEFERLLMEKGIEENVFIAGDLGHDAFMTMVSATEIHLRTPITDGVSACVLEALSLRVPVVASENGNRPASVITYKADCPSSLSEAMCWTLRNRESVVASLKTPEIVDTTRAEIELLMGRGSRAP